MAAGAELGLDASEHGLGLLGTAMGHHPTRRFRQPKAHEEDDEAEYSTNEKRQAPPQVRSERGGIEQHDRARRPEGGPDPKAAIDDEIGPAASITRRHELLDGRIDGGVFTADAGAGEESEERKTPKIPRQRGRRGGDEIDRKRDEE